jgi:hypothetical protein
MPRVFRTPADLTPDDIRRIFDGFDSTIASFDCGKKCAPHNPNGKPFCCDICHAVPAVYRSEWKYFEAETNLWHRYKAGECHDEGSNPDSTVDIPPAGMIPLACLGPDRCQRDFRAISCRAFPFFPYISSDFRFLGLACEWEYESQCWVMSNLAVVTQKYRTEFLQTFDYLLALFDDIFENYAYHSELLRAYSRSRRKRFPLLHRNGNACLVSPTSERMQSIDLSRLPKYGPYGRRKHQD